MLNLYFSCKHQDERVEGLDIDDTENLPTQREVHQTHRMNTKFHQTNTEEI